MVRSAVPDWIAADGATVDLVTKLFIFCLTSYGGYQALVNVNELNK